MKEISKDKLQQAGRYLDENPPILSTKESCKEEYWRQLIDALPFRFYTNVQIETFAEDPTGSPGLRLLVDLRERGLEYEPFLEALEQIKCFKALNLFVQSTVPVIDTQPESTSISPGGTLVLSCIGRCDPPSPSYQWYWNNQAIPNKRSHNLVINNVHANITGLYKCKVSNDRIPNTNYNHIWSKEIKVEIVKHPIPECGDDKPMEELPLGEPSLEERPLSYTSQYSSSIPCTSDTSNDTTTTTDNTTLDSSSTISLLSRSGRNSLPTTPVNLGRHPSSTLPSTVEISGDIEITKKFNDIKCRYDRPFTLECQARSKIGKELTFTWKLEKGKKPQILKQVDSVTTSVLTHEYDRHGTLTICCEITHTDKTTDDKAINRAKVDVETVWIVEEPESIRGYAGDTVSLTCKAEGKGPITYLWLKSKSNGQKKQKSKGPSKDREYRMVLEPEAWGLYICQAENSDGFVSSKEVSVQFDATDKKRADLRIIVQPLSIVCEKGSNVTLSCKAEPHEGTHYQWFFKNNQRRHSDSNSLIIHNVNDNHFGDYYCQVTNRGKTIKSNKVTLYLGRNRPKSIPDDDDTVHGNVFKKAVQSQGSLTFNIAQCESFGPPGVGKTCLLQRLVDEAIPGTPTTTTTIGSGSLSTDVLSESKMIQIEMTMDDDRGSVKPIVFEEGGKWRLVKSLKEEITLFIKSLQHQTEHNKSSKPDVKSSNDTSAATNATSDYDTTSTKQLLDDTVINAITRHVEGENVDLSRVQVLLDKSTTIFYTDTGGQPEFQEVLPALTAGPTIFLLFFSLHQSLDSKYKVLYETSSKKYKLSDSSFTVREALMQCLSSISSYHISQLHDFSQNQLMKCCAPPTNVLTVATHSDLVSKEVYTKVDQDLKQSVKKAIFGKYKIMEPYTREHLVIPMNNYNPEDGKNMRKVIERVIKRKVNGVSPYKVELPAHWFGLQLYLRQCGSAAISYSECLSISEKFGIPKEDLKSCLWYLHYKTGTIRYYHNVEKIKDIVIIQPKILFIAVTRFITSTFILDNVDIVVQDNFRTLGLFKSAEIRDIFNKHRDELEIEYDPLMALLDHLNILVFAHDEEYDFVLPSALVHAPVSYPSQYDTSAIRSLFIFFEWGFVPKGVFSGLLGSLIKRKWSIAFNHDDLPQLYRNKAILSIHHKVSNDIDCVLNATTSFIEVSFLHCKDNQFRVVCPYTRDVITDSMLEACSRLNYGNVWKFGAICNHDMCVDAPQHFAEFDSKLGIFQCQKIKKIYPPTTQDMLWFQGYYKPSSSIVEHVPDSVPAKNNGSSLHPVTTPSAPYPPTTMTTTSTTITTEIYRNERQQPDNIISADSSEDVFKGNSEDSLMKDKMIKCLSQELDKLKTEKESRIVETHEVSVQFGSSVPMEESRIVETHEVSVQFDYWVPMEDLLHGARIVDEKVFYVQGSGEQFFEWSECGFSLHVPEGALLATETCPVAVKALIAGNFQFPKHTQLISSLYAISAAREFRKPVQTTMEHCLKVERKTQLERMHFIKAHQTHKGKPYIFEIEAGGNFEINSQFGSFWQHSFSTGGIVLEDQILPVPVDDESTSNDSDQSDDNPEIEDEQDYSNENSLEHVHVDNDIPSNVDAEEVTTPHDVTISDNIAQESTTAMTSPENDDVIKYHALTFYEPKAINRYSHTFVAFQKLTTSIKFVTSYFSNQPRVEKDASFTFNFEHVSKPCLTLDFKEDRLIGKGWHVTPTIDPSEITEQEIKSLGHEVEMQGLNDIQLTYPFIPTCLTYVYADPGTTCNLIYPLPIKGIKPPKTIYIQRFIDHQLENQRSSPDQSSVNNNDPKRLVVAIKKNFTANEARLSYLFVDHDDGTIRKFATEMHQANLISQPIARNPSYHTIVDQFMAALQFPSEQSEIEQKCLTFFQILYDIGGPFEMASVNMREELVQKVKSSGLNIDLNLREQAGLHVRSIHNNSNSSVIRRRRSDKLNHDLSEVEDTRNISNPINVALLICVIFLVLVLIVVFLALVFKN